MSAGIEVVRRGIKREGESGKVMVALEVNGIVGRFEFIRSLTHYNVRGAFASHTGFHSTIGGFTETIVSYDDETFYARATDIAIEYYEQAEALPFLVGDEHKEHGWKKLRENYRGELEIRLPDWHEGIVASELESLGVKLGCSANNFWVFEKGTKWDDAKAILAPLMAKGTRLLCERRLVQQLRDSITCQGFIPGELLSQGGIQPQLF